MQISSVQQASRQQLQDEILSLIRSRVVASDTARKGVRESVAGDKPADAGAPAGPAQTERAVQQINEALKVLSTSLRFQLDEESGRTVVKVVDGDSGEVLRQIPSEATLQIARSLDRLVGQLVSHKI